MKNYIIILLSICFLTPLYAGGGKRNGTNGASELLIPAGTRGISMGSAAVASSKGLEALYWNPAGLAWTSCSAEALFSYQSYISDIGVTYGAVSANISDFGVIAFSIKALSMDAINVTTVDNPDGTGQTFTPQFLTAGLSFSRALSDRISVGLTGNLISESMDRVSAKGVAFNVGVVYQNLGNLNGLNLGITVNNLGPEMKFDGTGLYQKGTIPELERPAQYYKVESAGFELPSNLELGLSYTRMLDESNSLLVSSAFQNSNFSGDEYKLGAEYIYADLLALRAGYTFIPESQEKQSIYGLSLGVGINYRMPGSGTIRFDYAYRDVDTFKANHIFSLALGL